MRRLKKSGRINVITVIEKSADKFNQTLKNNKLLFVNSRED